MAVVFDAVGTEGKQTVLGTTGISYTGLTIGAALSNGALVVGLASDVTVSSVAVVWDSGGASPQSMTVIGTQADGSGHETQFWGLVNPNSGNKTLKVTWNAVTAEMYIGADSWSGVDQTGGATSFAHYNSAIGTSTTPSVAVTSAIGNAVMAILAQDNNINSVSGSPNAATVLWTIDNSGPNIGVAAFRAAGASTQTMSAVLGAAPGGWTISGVDIVAAPAAVVITPSNVAGLVASEW